MRAKTFPNPPSEIIIYGTDWCFSSRRARQILDENRLTYRWVNIDYDLTARRQVEEINQGYRSVPTILFPDGSVLVEPDEETLMAHLRRFLPS
jgi:mycoredoxin